MSSLPLFLPTFLTPPTLSSPLMKRRQMFMTDEKGEGSDVIPSPICIGCVAGPALVSTRLQSTRGACGGGGGDVCRRERYTRSPTGAVIRKSCKNYQALGEFHLHPLASETSSTSVLAAHGDGDTGVIQCKLSEAKVRGEERGDEGGFFCLRSPCLCSEETNLGLFFSLTNLCQRDFFKRSHVRPLPLQAFHPLQSFIHASVYPSFSLRDTCFGLVAMYVRHCSTKVFFTFPLGLLAGLMLLLLL